MSGFDHERTILKQRLHWGFFVLPLLAVGALFWIMLPSIVAFRFIRAMLVTIDPGGISPMFHYATLSVFFPVFALSFALLVGFLVAYVKSKIVLTDRRLLFSSGLFLRFSGEVPLEEVETVILTEPVLGRLLGYGTITITSLNGLQVPLAHIALARKFHRLLQNAIASSKRSLAHSPLDDSRHMPQGQDLSLN